MDHLGPSLVMPSPPPLDHPNHLPKVTRSLHLGPEVPPQRRLMKVPFPVWRNPSRGARHWLIARVVSKRSEHRTLDDRFAAVVPEPVLPRLEALDHRVTGRLRVSCGVLTRRCVATADVATEGTATE